jgi:uncharacterized protein (DUF58 family)
MWQRFLLSQYRFIDRFDDWVKRHFTLTGHIVIAFLIASAVFGVDTRQSTTYQLFVFLLVLLVFSLVGGLFNHLKLTITRQLPRYGTVGEPLRYSVTLNNLTPRTYDRLALSERLHTTFPDAKQLAQFYALHTKPWYQRSISFRLWRDCLSYQRGGIIVELELPPLTPKALTVTHSFIPTRRGVIQFMPSTVAKPDLLGLFRRLIDSGESQNCTVLPKRYPIKPLNLAGKRKYQAGGVSLANSVGNSSEFMALRDYQQGDPLHSIHWKSYAKHGKLIVKDYQDEYFVRRALVLDTSVGTASRAQFEAAVSVAASLASSEHYHEALLDLLFVGKQSYCFTAGRGVDQLTHLQEILAGVQASSEQAFQQLAQTVLARIGLCSSLVCVFMHWDTARQNFIQQLLAHGLPVAVFLLDDGRLTVTDCPNHPTYFYLLDYQRLEQQLAEL